MNLDFSRRKALQFCGAGVGAGLLSLLNARQVNADQIKEVLDTEEAGSSEAGSSEAGSSEAGISEENIQKALAKEIPLEAMQKAYKAGVLSEKDSVEEYNFYFFFISVLSGLGIAIDVFVATLAMYRKLNTRKKQVLWAALVGGSHIALPVLTGGATWVAKQGLGQEDHSDMISRGISAAGFAAITKFLWDELVGEEDEEEEVDILSAKNWKALCLAVWGVSADAAFSGPAKADQAIIEEWSTKKTLISAGIGGLTVAAVALVGVAIADYLRNSSNEKVEEFLENNEDQAMALETLVLNYFGTNALLNGACKLDLNFLTTVIINGFSSGALLKVTQTKES